ncbi:Nicotinate phosphoribosyltransferase, partial [Candidatus Arthromitus sp. SFB-4]
EPVLGGVYKLCALYKNDVLIPKIKISENHDKITISGLKTVYRIFDSKTNMAIADLITNFYDTIDETKPLTIFDPNFTWKKKVITDFYTIKLHKKIFDKGVCVYKSPSVMEIHKIKNKEFSKLWPEITRLENPQNYFVDLSKNLWNSHQDLLNKYSNKYI